MFNIARWIPIIFNAMRIVQKVKDASGKDKLQAVVDNLAEELVLMEDIAGKDLLNDDDVKLTVANVVAAIKSLENLIKAKKAK